MTGNFEHKIDAKGRLFIPSSLRDELGKEFHVTISFENCLNAFSGDGWVHFEENVKAMKLSERHKMRPFFSNASKCVLDSQGRILIPQNLRDRIGLKKDVTIVGAGAFVQIWDSEVFKRIDALETTPDNLAKVMDELDF
ncbi:MAG: division/cell wall cluster transcriptional repressor MraZ [Oscillospiraceae bacterium]|nr:division/cell wall cluster transcriptional repressor MraZ [Oscillospiraceae bacterium]